MFLARKFTRAKWQPKAGIAAREIPADAVTVDLRTTDNTLSFWRYGEAGADGVRQVALAIAATAERVDKLDIVWVAEEMLRADGVRMQDTNGETPVRAMVKEHVDAAYLDLIRLGKVAFRIAQSIRETRCARYTRQEVITLLTSAVEKRFLDLSALKDKVQDVVRAAISTGSDR